MSVYRPKRSPYYHYDFIWHGRRFHASTGTANREIAKSIEASIRTKVITREHFDTKEEMTVDVALGRYFTEVAERQASARSTFYQLATLRRILGTRVHLSELSNVVVSDYVCRRQSDRSKRGGPLAPTTINRELDVLRRVINRCRDVWDVRVSNINWKAHRLQEPDFRERYLTEDEEKRLLEAAADHLKGPIRFSLLTGVRLSNVMGLDWSQIDFESRQITFRVKSRKPGGKVHVLPITDALFRLLKGLAPKGRGHVFTYNGQPLKTWRTAWASALRRPAKSSCSGLG